MNLNFDLVLMCQEVKAHHFLPLSSSRGMRRLPKPSGRSSNWTVLVQKLPRNWCGCRQHNSWCVTGLYCHNWEANFSLKVKLCVLFQEYGLTREQSSNALILHGTVQKAVEVLFKVNQPGECLPVSGLLSESLDLNNVVFKVVYLWCILWNTCVCV